MCQVVVFLGPVQTLYQVVEVVVKGNVVNPWFYVCVEMFVEEGVLKYFCCDLINFTVSLYSF